MSPGQIPEGSGERARPGQIPEGSGGRAGLPVVRLIDVFKQYPGLRRSAPSTV